jgi:lysophospholipase L1-like esterase
MMLTSKTSHLARRWAASGLGAICLILSACATGGTPVAVGPAPAISPAPAASPAPVPSPKLRLEQIHTLVLDEALGAGDTLLNPEDPRYAWEGRVDFTEPAQPRMVFSGAKASIRFRGPALSLGFEGGTGQNWFNLIVDGELRVLGPLPFVKSVYAMTGLNNDLHEAVIFKRSEAQAGSIRFLGFGAPGGEILEAPPRPSRRIEILGDSISAGACNEDGKLDQWADRSTHNFYNSYGAIAARALGASISAAVNSGSGVSQGWNEYEAIEYWDRQDLGRGAALAPPSDPPPDAFIINLGENDDSFSRTKIIPFPADFTVRYLELARAVRARYPQTLIVCALGGMWGGRHSAVLRDAWEAALDILEAEDPRVRRLLFEHSTLQHPRVPDHEIMASELEDFLRRELGW